MQEIAAQSFQSRAVVSRYPATGMDIESTDLLAVTQVYRDRQVRLSGKGQERQSGLLAEETDATGPR